MDDAVVPLTVFDRTGVDFSTITLSYILGPGISLVSLEGAARSVIGKWRLLAGRVESLGEGHWGIRVPLGPLPPDFVYCTITTSSLSTPLSPPPLDNLSAAVLTRPPFSLFHSRTRNTSLASFARSRCPLLAVHATTLPDAVCVGITLPHGVFDATGFGMVLHALDAELGGRDWVAPPLTAAPNPFLEAIARAPSSVEKESHHQELLRDYVTPTVLNWFWVLWTLLVYEYLWHRVETKGIFLSNRAVDRIVKPVKKEVEGGGAYVSTGDVLLSWIFKASYLHSTSASTVAITSVFSPRSLFPSLPPYPHNAAVTISHPLVHASALSTSPLSLLAQLHRRTLLAARTPAFLKSYTTHLTRLHSALIRRRPHNDHWIITNQVVADLTTLTAFGPVRGFWIFEAPILADHVVMFNKVEEGYLLMATLRKSQWASVTGVVEVLSKAVRDD